MTSEVTMALIAMVSGGGLTAIINAFVERSKNKKDMKDKDIDDRILVWQKISDRNEQRIAQLEQKLANCERDFRSLERYVLSLEQVIMFADPPLKLPQRPALAAEATGGQ